MTIKLLQWNIWYKEKPENVAELIKHIDPDIVCLQEVTVNYPHQEIKNVPDYLAKESGLNLHFQEAQYWPTDEGRALQGNAILSKHYFVSQTHTFIQDQKHQDFDDYSREGRVLVFGQFDIKGQPITIATTHMSYNHRFEETEMKILEEDNLLKVISEYDRNFILTGDFNVTPKSRLVSELEKTLINAGPDYPHNTWTTKPFSYNGFEENELNWRLDYVFTTSDIKVINSEIIQTDYSDHLPVLVEIGI